MKPAFIPINQMISKDKSKDTHERIRKFSLRVLNLYTALPKTKEARVIGMQALQAATSVGAHLRAGEKCGSDSERIGKLEEAVNQLGETGFWFELMRDSEIVPVKRLNNLLAEANEIKSILVDRADKIKPVNKE